MMRPDLPSPVMQPKKERISRVELFHRIRTFKACPIVGYS